MGKQGTRYTDEFRANAVLMLEAAGYPDREGALSRVARHIGVPHPTLSRWYRAVQNPPPDELVHKKKVSLIDDLTDLLGLSISAARGTVNEAAFRELATGIGIFIDKIQLLTGQPTERAEVHVNDHRERLLADVARKSAGLADRDAGGVHTRPIG